jgi:hypothetical protein
MMMEMDGSLVIAQNSGVVGEHERFTTVLR